MRGFRPRKSIRRIEATGLSLRAGRLGAGRRGGGRPALLSVWGVGDAHMLAVRGVDDRGTITAKVDGRNKGRVGMTSRPRDNAGRVLIAVAFGLILTLCPVTGAYAVTASVSPITLHASVGYQSYYNPRVWVPVHVTLDNAGSRTVSGDLRYGIGSVGAYPYEGALDWPVVIRPHATATLDIGIPGRLLSDNGSLQYFIGGKLAAQVHMLGVVVGNSDMAGVISDHPEAVQFLAGVSSSNGLSDLVVPFIAPSAMPDSSQLLQSLNYLYIDGAAAEELTSTQTAAVFEWVRAGGILVLGGVEPSAGQIGGFARVSPVMASIVIDEPATLLGEYAGSAPPRGLVAQLFGEASPGADVLIGTPGHALLATRPMGRGEVAYVGLSASDPALVSWSGNAMFWDLLLHSLQRQVLPAVPNLFGSNGLSSLMGAAELFPQLHTPPLWIWELVFALYLLVCGPLLYALLRRRHKSEWAWLLLPAFSIVLAGAIYELGVVQRPNGILTQSVGLADIVDGDEAQLVGVQALMSPQARTYAVTLAPMSWVIPLAERLTGFVKDGTVTYAAGGDSLQFEHVQAWGGRFVYAERTAHHMGDLAGQLFESGASVGGFVVNHTQMDFTDLAIVVRGQVYGLGSLGRGKSVTVDVTIKPSGQRAPFVNQLAGALPSSTHGVGRALFDYARAFAGVDAPANTAILVGWTHDEPHLFYPDGADLPAEPQWIVRQVMPMQTVHE